MAAITDALRALAKELGVTTPYLASCIDRARVEVSPNAEWAANAANEHLTHHAVLGKYNPPA